MKINWLLVAGLGLGAAVLYAMSKTSSAGALTGQPTNYTTSSPGATITMKVGDSLAVTGPTGAPSTSGTAVFGGSETVLANGAANATAAGTEVLTWPGWGSITVTAS